MMDWSQWIDFKKFDIGSAPTTSGVFCLRHHREVTYYGVADGPGGIREQLLEHIDGKKGDCTRLANGYCYAECDEPAEVVERMLSLTVLRLGSPPRCNNGDTERVPRSDP